MLFRGFLVYTIYFTLSQIDPPQAKIKNHLFEAINFKAEIDSGGFEIKNWYSGYTGFRFVAKNYRLETGFRLSEI